MSGPDVVLRSSLHVRLRRDTLEKIAKLAQESHRSLNGQIATMLDWTLRLMEQRQQ